MVRNPATTSVCSCPTVLIHALIEQKRQKLTKQEPVRCVYLHAAKTSLLRETRRFCEIHRHLSDFI
jgi:hypothetical protein